MRLRCNDNSASVHPFHHRGDGEPHRIDFTHKKDISGHFIGQSSRCIRAHFRLFSVIPSRKVCQWHNLGWDGVPMGTIVPRKRKDGTIGHRAQIILKRDGTIIHRESKTFDRRQAAKAWLSRRETALAEPGALDRPDDPKLAAVIDRYIAESQTEIGRTKKQVLETIKDYDIAEMTCSAITSPDIITFARALPVAPQTVQSYLSHLGKIFTLARPAWGYPLDRRVMDDALVAANNLGITAKGNSRDRRPTLDELELLMEHFGRVRAHRPRSAPMQKIIAFAIFSTRRQEEITRIAWSDYQQTRVLVRDMKHPGDKKGNHTWCDLPPEATAIIETMPRSGKTIFPYTTDAISAAFTRACFVLGINTKDMPDAERLHFHDLRHDGVSRLFEMGRTIPQAASVSGHRSWSSLKRYSHLRQAGDKYENWKWKIL